MRISRKGITGVASIAKFLHFDEEVVEKILIPVMKRSTRAETYEVLNRVNMLIHLLGEDKLGAYGIESFYTPNNIKCLYTYVNRGDLYAPTVIYSWEHDYWIVLTIGDLVEYDKRFREV